MSHPHSSDAWTVHQFFHGAYDPVQAAHWYEASVAQKKRDKKEKEKAKPRTVNVELLCQMCCEACSKRVRKALDNDEAIISHTVDLAISKVSISGHDLKPQDVLKMVARAANKPTEFWPKPASKKNKGRKH